TDNNSADFVAGTVNPRNSAHAPTTCGGGGGGGADMSVGPDMSSSITLPSPTLPPVQLSNLVVGAMGDTRPPASQTTGHSTSLKTIIGSIFTGLQAHGVPFAVAAGDYCFSPSGAGSGVPQFNDFMTARNNFANTFLPAQGNHECITSTTGNCPVGS